MTIQAAWHRRLAVATLQCNLFRAIAIQKRWRGALCHWKVSMVLQAAWYQWIASPENKSRSYKEFYIAAHASWNAGFSKKHAMNILDDALGKCNKHDKKEDNEMMECIKHQVSTMVK